MKLGAFSISLSVKNLEVSKNFYETLGFEVFAGALAQKYLIMKNGDSLIGLFEAMFEGNLLTFNPGWDQNAQALKDWNDVREIAKHLEENGIKANVQIDNESGPGSLTLQDPDGNMILIDQHQ
ncbi:VOC family protein [Soonwooa sp.]|uniref:VOC family protein n=1 Tax=Soonwooa sp. TaxID=1938592 RepID=UPI0028AB4FED|nr:VOC family protein [Soonwooa sp.]